MSVYLHRKTGKYAAQKSISGQRFFLGLHTTPEEAREAVLLFESRAEQPNPAATPAPHGPITQERVRELFKYSPETGQLVWKVRTGNRINVGDVAGHENRQGYISVRVDGRLYQAHRIIWLYLYGAFPENEIDHVDGNGTNNMLVNLRPATSSENKQNCVTRKDNSIGCTGVYHEKKSGKYVAVIAVNGKSKTLGRFSKIEEAVEARRDAKKKHHKFNPIQRAL